MKTSRYVVFILAMGVLLIVSSCKSSSGLSKDTTTLPASTAAVDYGRKVMKNAQSSKAVTAKVKVKVQADGKEVTVNGNLKMMRDEVIQLSLSMLGFEIGKLEFQTDEVLIIDKFHRQYVKVPYSKVDFLNKTNLDFNALQAIFWGELFVPGAKDVASQLDKFSLSSSGDHTLLSLKNEPRLEYDFLTNTTTTLLNRIGISPKNVTEEGAFVCKYSSYTKFQGKSFPNSIDLSFSGEGVKAGLTMTLSDLGNRTDWNTRTEVSSKYKQVDARGILNKLMAQ